MKRWQIATLVVFALICLGLGFVLVTQNRTVSNEGNPGNAQEITIKQVEQHGSVSNCWVIIGTKVFNATAYLTQHPESDVKMHCGSQLPADKKTSEALNQFYIGLLVP